MNIFKQKYRCVRERLKIFGKKYRGVLPSTRDCADFWTEELHKAERDSWDYVCLAYLTNFCSDEEREFVDAVFFQEQNTVAVGERFYMSERLCYFWSETILKDIIALAAECGLISFDMDGEMREVASTLAFGIDDGVWEEIETLVSKAAAGKHKNLRRDVEAMAAVVYTDMTWRDLPEKYGPWKTVYNKYSKWVKTGLWKRIDALLKNNTKT